MRIIGDKLIVAVDAGYGNMKTADTSFPTGLAVYEKKPYFTENLLEYDGKFYVIGTGHKEFTDQKIMDEDYYVLTLAAIASELAHHKRNSGKIILAVGLPLTWIVSQQAAYREYLLKNRTVEFRFRGQAYHIELVDALVFPQGFAAVTVRLGEMRDVNVVADIGNGTVNLLKIVDQSPIITSMSTEACGVKDCAIAMRTALANEHSGAKVDDSVMERIIRSGTAKIDEAYLKTLTDAARQYTADLFRRFREYGFDEKTMRLYVVGGGACLIRNFGSYDPSRIRFVPGISANAIGYEYLAAAKLAKAGETG